jgi:hypothetical protein
LPLDGGIFVMIFTDDTNELQCKEKTYPNPFLRELGGKCNEYETFILGGIKDLVGPTEIEDKLSLRSSTVHTAKQDELRRIVDFNISFLLVLKL